MSKPLLPIEGEVSAPAKNGKKKQLAVVENAPAPTSEIAWLQTIKELAPTIGIEGVRELMGMRREERRDANEREFNAAMSEAQAALKAVVKNRKNDQTKSKYADLAAIADAAMPTIYEHGFGVICSEFESKKPDHLGVAFEITHRSGHSKRYEFNVPFDGAGMKGNPNKTPTHAYGSTLSYGERYAKCKVFGIATKDDDGNAAGKAETAVEQATEKEVDELSELIKQTDAAIETTQIIFEHYKVEKLADLTKEQCASSIKQLKKKLGIK